MTMQPPPRKGNYAKFLKNLHSEQTNKLLLKNQHECDLLEDIRTFTIKRSAIEKSYSEALLKMSSAYLNKKIPNIPDIKMDGGEEKWNMWNVWRTVLEENEKLARARLAAVEVFQQQIADDAKILRAYKVQAARKCAEQLSVIQKELQECVQELDKTKKLYFDEEHCAHDVRDKARDIEEKLKKKKGSFFQSITSLQKNSAKFSSKRDQLEEKSSGARNDYLLCLASANAHQTRYFVVDLHMWMSFMEAGVYEKVAEYFSLMGRTELLTCSAMQNSFSTIRNQAKQLSRDYNLQCCFLYYPVLKQHIQYDFEPCDDDPVETVTIEHDSAAATLDKEARRWAAKIARDNNIIRTSLRQIQTYSALRDAGHKCDPNAPNEPDLETKIEDLRQAIRRAETSKVKAEARIECLKKGGVDVDDILQEAEALNAQDIQRSTSSLSDHQSSDSFYDSDAAEAEGSSAPSSNVDKTADLDDQPMEHSDSPDVDAMLEQEKMRMDQMSAGWDDPTQVNWDGDDTGESNDVFPGHRGTSTPLLKCTALYSYTAQNPDELSIVENEQLEVVGEGDGDGWLKARNYKGEEGYVPHNYLDVERGDQMLGTSTSAGLSNQISFSSVDYTVDEDTAGDVLNGPSEAPSADNVAKRQLSHSSDSMSDKDEELTFGPSETNQSPEQVSVISVKAINEMPPSQPPPPAPPVAAESCSSEDFTYCFALYDYDNPDGDPEELSFEEGQIIKVLSKRAHSPVDDGWWRGEFDGQVGIFPSLVVEECDEFGEPFTTHSDETPPETVPPVFTPPDAPPIIETDHHLEFDDEEDDSPLPATSSEHHSSTTSPDNQPPNTNQIEHYNEDTVEQFSMQMSRDQKNVYNKQFSESEECHITEIVPPQNDDKQTSENHISKSITERQNSVEAKTRSQRKPAPSEKATLGFAQIVITAATPMVEDPEKSFPPAPPPPPPPPLPAQATPSTQPTAEDCHQTQDYMNQELENETEITSEAIEDTQSTESASTVAAEGDKRKTFATASGSIGSEESESQDTSILDSESQADSSLPKQVVGGRASIPDELEPHQLARLQTLKESNA